MESEGIVDGIRRCRTGDVLIVVWNVGDGQCTDGIMEVIAKVPTIAAIAC